MLMPALPISGKRYPSRLSLQGERYRAVLLQPARKEKADPDVQGRLFGARRGTGEVISSPRA
jgi:hypothetical protein